MRSTAPRGATIPCPWRTHAMAVRRDGGYAGDRKATVFKRTFTEPDGRRVALYAARTPPSANAIPRRALEAANPHLPRPALRGEWVVAVLVGPGWRTGS